VRVIVDGGEATIEAHADVTRAWPSSAVALLVATRGGVPIYYDCSPELGPLEPGPWTYRARLGLPFPPGEFTVMVIFRSMEPEGRFERTRPIPFTSDGRPTVVGVADLAATVTPSAR
jgi:hypothetical protein